MQDVRRGVKQQHGLALDHAGPQQLPPEPAGGVQVAPWVNSPGAACVPDPRPDAAPRRSAAPGPPSPVAALDLAGDPTLAGMSTDAVSEVHDVVIVGAGIAGLACARVLRDAGREVVGRRPSPQ